MVANSCALLGGAIFKVAVLPGAILIPGTALAVINRHLWLAVKHSSGLTRSKCSV